MTWTQNRNGTNSLHEEGPYEQGRHDDTHEQRQATDRERGPSPARIRAQHCILCQTETVGACLLCHRPLCEQCGASSDDFLRCPGHNAHEVEALRTILRQAAESVLSTRQYLTDLVALRNRVLSEVNAALLRSYVEHTGGVPSPAQIQQMRRVAVALWNSLAVVDTEVTLLGAGEEEAQQQASEHDEP